MEAVSRVSSRVLLTRSLEVVAFVGAEIAEVSRREAPSLELQEALNFVSGVVMRHFRLD